MKKLTIGMPDGSLANPNRGQNLAELLARAGLETRNYGTSKPTEFPYVPWLEPRDGRPRFLIEEVARGDLDVCIAGDDIATENNLQSGNSTVRKILGLNKGKTRLVAAAPEDKYRSMAAYLQQRAAAGVCSVIMASEYPAIAQRFLLDKISEAGLTAVFGGVTITDYLTERNRMSCSVIARTEGKTEAMFQRGSVDLIVETTQSGASLGDQGLFALEEVMRSEASLYAAAARYKTNNQWKSEKIETVKMALQGVLAAEGIEMLVFNVPAGQVSAVYKYLRQQRLFASEPSIVKGDEFWEFTIQLDTRNPELPLVDVQYALRKLGAEAIDRFPLLSSAGNKRGRGK
ncbi:hypothetical protein J4475_01295 [Candidatus Woesearchaeota archaeon]|nr:hypothetical protein [Candidatus Woesearchaeota archaeon]